MSTKIKAKRERAEAIIRGYAGEPNVTKDNYREQFIAALNWYNANCEEKDFRKYAEHYAKKLGMKECLYCISKADYIELKGIGSVGRLIARGQYVDLDDAERALRRLIALKHKYVKPVAVSAVQSSVAPVSVQERIAESARTVAADIDEQVDLFATNGKSEFSARTYLQANSVSGVVAKKVVSLYQPIIKELEEAVKGQDPQLKEGYSNFTKPKLRKFLDFIKSVVADCSQQAVSASATRKPRVRKVKPPSVVVSKMKYMKEYSDLQLKSINPANIIGASELWVYNPTTRKLTVFRGADGGQLGVNRMSIINYDVTTSETKTLRKPEEFFKGLSLGKRAMANAWKAVRAKVSKPRSRINEEMILLAAN